MLKYFNQFFIFLVLFVLSYYAIYFILFNIDTSRGPLISLVQEKMIISKSNIADVLNEFDTKEKYNFLFFGSSHSNQEFNPEIFEKAGVSAFNLGSRAQSPLISYVLLKEFIQKTHNVILEVFPGTVGVSGEESFFRLVPSIDDYQILTSMAWELNDLRCYNLLSIKPLIDNYNDNSKTKESSKIGYNGYYETSDSAGPITYKPWGFKIKELDKQLEYINKMTRLCRKNNVGICLVLNPIPKELTISDEVLFINKIKKISVDLKIRFYNYGRNHSLDSKSHFFDDNHLNKAGIEIYNNLLIQKMKEDKFISMQ